MFSLNCLVNWDTLYMLCFRARKVLNPRSRLWTKCIKNINSWRTLFLSGGSLIDSPK